MSNSAEHKADMDQLARDRRRDGKPVWEHEVNLADVFFHSDEVTFEQSRDGIVARIRASTWFKAKDEYDDLVFLVEELADSESEDAFDYVWDQIYYVADYDRVWIATF
jgi:hypothetical protein